MLCPLSVLLFLFSVSAQQSEANDSPQQSPSLNQRKVIDEQTDPLVVDGETAWEGLQIQGWTSPIPRRFLELYFQHKTDNTKRQNKNRLLGPDLFDDQDAKVPRFPQPNAVRMNVGQFGVQPTSAGPENPSFTTKQFDQNSSDLQHQLETETKIVRENKNEAPTSSKLFFGAERGEAQKGNKIGPARLILIPTKSPPTHSESTTAPSKPSPITQPTTTKKRNEKEWKAPQCSDTVNDCADRQHLCDSAKYGEIMWRMCPFTCDACFKKSDKPTCVDASPLCARRVRHCQISYYTAIMNRVCPKTCKSC